MSREDQYPGRKTVLLVERDWTLGRLIARILHPHEVRVANWCSQAVEMLAHHRVDTVVFDPTATSNCGIDFMIALRNHPQVRIVVYTLSREIERIGAYGLAHATLLKPASDEQLCAAILGISDSREFEHP